MRPTLPLLALIFAANSLAGQSPMTPVDSARHVLNRLAYGATPGEIDQVAREGVLRWVDRQLGFGSVDDSGLAPLEQSFEVVHVSALDMQEMQQNNIAKLAKLQAAGDTGTRLEMRLNRVRDSSAGDRRSLQNLLAQLQTLTVTRAVSSDHQFDEILTDFWTNHFNVFINKGQDRSYFADYLEHVIRPHALGKFEDLLLATARSPAMLFYLDNAQSVAPGTAEKLAAMQEARAELAMARGRGRGGFGGRGRMPPAGFNAGRAGVGTTQQQAKARAPQGLNENYARELMELHTLGVDGGYTQQDVINVARILTGWTIDRRTASFTFRPQAHDEDAKVVLGVAFGAGHAEDEGVRLLKMLASNPATMHHVSAELCARFVADVPPDGCIDDAVRAWKQSDGDVRTVVRAIIHSPDFWASVNVQSKIKTPLEFVTSAVRAVAGVPDSTPRLAQRVAQLGEPLFQHQTPDGYGERQEDWVNSGALLARMNFAVQLASGHMPGVTVDLDRVLPLADDHVALVDAVNRTVLGGLMTAQTRQTIVKELSDVADPQKARALAVGLALGGPEFQKQ